MTNTILRAANETISPEAMNQTLANIRSSLGEGGIGIGAPIGYLPKTNPGEMYQVYKLAGELNALVYSHVRNPDIISIQEAIAVAVLTGAPLHTPRIAPVPAVHAQTLPVQVQAPDLHFEQRLTNPPAFADSAPERALKVLVYRAPG